jgi:hypothetical protein
MFNLTGTSSFAIEFGEGFSMSHIAFENSTYFASLPIAEHPRSSAFIEQEIDFLERFLSGFLLTVSIETNLDLTCWSRTG